MEGLEKTTLTLLEVPVPESPREEVVLPESPVPEVLTVEVQLPEVVLPEVVLPEVVLPEVVVVSQSMCLPLFSCFFKKV